MQTRPKVEDGVVANTISRLLASAFRGCVDKIDVRKSFPLQLEFASQAGQLKTQRKGAGPLERCLFAALDGKKLAKWPGSPRIRIQVRPVKAMKAKTQ